MRLSLLLGLFSSWSRLFCDSGLSISSIQIFYNKIWPNTLFYSYFSQDAQWKKQEWYGLPRILFEEIERAPNPACITSYILQISTLLSFQDILRMLLSFWRFTSAKLSNEEMSTAGAGCKKAKKWNSTKGRKSTRGIKSHLLSGGGKCQELSVFWSLSTSIKI